ncbi:diguanylate cyclase [Kineococcus radiotolerans SRS30216 = ATCC BAA-149]|uniref:Diguanylate cyclase n=1 Tax=Kineococcus radiotolerans (strain ATCC BAA-149 / DSM 14245 / SRS30216) TaxID=266940 RepID=A6WFN5_KINRD|nr:diguanylate cyclase [Kineococcus radiotolerans SRS30216 = ATCC BAA-149]
MRRWRDVHRSRPTPSLVVVAAVGGLLAVALACLPTPGTDASTIAYLVPVASCTAVTALAVVRVPRAHRGPWWWLLASQVLYLAGEVSFARLALRGDGSWPTSADLLYLAAYVPVTVGVLRLDRGRSTARHRGNLLDAAVLSLSAATLFGVFVVLPTASDGSQPLPARVVSSVYPVCDVLLVFLVARLVTGPGSRPPAFWLLVAGSTCTIVADVAWNLQQLTTGGTTAPRWVDVLWLLYYVSLAVAAASARRPWPRVETGEDAGGLSAPRLVVLAVAAVLPSAVLVVMSLLHRETPVAWLAAGSLALVALVVARVWDLLQQLRRQSQRLEAMARTDPLTGLANRRTLDHHLARVCRPGTPGEVVLALLDLDHFKAYNDSRGHQAGDDLLRAASAAWTAHLGPRGLLARWGGEEFVAVVVDESVERATALLDELRALVPEGQTCSVGVSRWDRAEPPAEALRRADAFLYAAKAAGRDRLAGPRPARTADPAR